MTEMGLPFEEMPTTIWSDVRRVGLSGSQVNRGALETLLRRYTPAMQSYLVQGRGFAPTVAADVVQSFVLDKFLEDNVARNADQAKGKFRTYLLTILDRFARSYQRKERAKKRGGGIPPEDVDSIDLADGARPATDAYDVTWARQLIEEAIRRMEAECRELGRDDLWGVFEYRVLRPVLEGERPLRYEAIVERFGFATPAQASNALITAKRLFQRVLRSLIGEYATSPEAIDEEIRDLWAVLSKLGAGSGGVRRIQG